jgi:tetratricopeptide (TPR) repeat protein
LSEADYQYKFQQALNDNLEAEFIELQKKEKLHSNSPDHAIELAQLANLYIAKAKRYSKAEYYDQAQTITQKSLSLLPQNKPALLSQSKIFAARHQFGDALRTLDLLTQSHPEDSESAYLKAVNYLAIGNYAEALKKINTTLNQKPDLASATLKAVILSHIGQDDLAFYYFKKSLFIEDIGEEFQSTITRGQFAQFMAKKGEYQLAHQICDAGLKINPDSPYLKSVKAQILIQQKSYSAANKLAEQAFSTSKDPLHLLTLIYTLKILKQEDSVETLSQQLKKTLTEDLEKNEYGHLIDLSAVYFLQGNYDLSEKTLLQDSKNRKNSKANLMLAKIYYLQNKLQLSKELCEEEVLKGTTESAFYYLMSDILKQQKNFELSETYLNLAKKLNKNFNYEILYQVP